MSTVRKLTLLLVAAGASACAPVQPETAPIRLTRADFQRLDECIYQQAQQYYVRAWSVAHRPLAADVVDSIAQRAALVCDDDIDTKLVFLHWSDSDIQHIHDDSLQYATGVVERLNASAPKE
jgi:hypothetical protein